MIHYQEKLVKEPELVREEEEDKQGCDFRQHFEGGAAPAWAQRGTVDWKYSLWAVWARGKGARLPLSHSGQPCPQGKAVGTESGLEFKLPDASSSLESKSSSEAMSSFPKKALRHGPLKNSYHQHPDQGRRTQERIWESGLNINIAHCNIFKNCVLCVF